MRKVLLFTVVLLMFGCDEGKSSIIPDSFYSDLAKIDCDSIYNCCGDTDDYIFINYYATHYSSINACYSGQKASYKKLFNENYYKIEEENLEDNLNNILTQMSNYLAVGCKEPTLPENKQKVTDAIISVFKPNRKVGESCLDSSNCIDGTCGYYEDSNYVNKCTRNATNGEECMFSDPSRLCVEGFKCIAGHCHHELFVGDECIQNNCGYESSANIFCGDDNICREKLNPGDSCDAENGDWFQCKTSCNSETGLCNEYKPKEYKCLLAPKTVN